MANNKAGAHTQGEWKYEEEEQLQGTLFTIVDKEGNYLAELDEAAHIHELETGELEANAKLIAAAPDMLEALKAAKEYLLSLESKGRNRVKEYRIITAAIKKAE